MSTNSNENVVYSYTEAQAIADDTLVMPIKDKDNRLLMTNTLYVRLVEVASGRGVTIDQVVVPLAMDARMIVIDGLRKDPGERLWTRGMEGNATGEDIWIARNGMGGITLMFPSDY